MYGFFSCSLHTFSCARLKIHNKTLKDWNSGDLNFFLILVLRTVYTHWATFILSATSTRVLLSGSLCYEIFLWQEVLLYLIYFNRFNFEQTEILVIKHSKCLTHCNALHRSKVLQRSSKLSFRSVLHLMNIMTKLDGI
jgi:hypothetical protein